MKFKIIEFLLSPSHGREEGLMSAGTWFTAVGAIATMAGVGIAYIVLRRTRQPSLIDSEGSEERPRRSSAAEDP